MMKGKHLVKVSKLGQVFATYVSSVCSYSFQRADSCAAVGVIGATVYICLLRYSLCSAAYCSDTDSSRAGPTARGTSRHYLLCAEGFPTSSGTVRRAVNYRATRPGGTISVLIWSKGATRSMVLVSTPLGRNVTGPSSLGAGPSPHNSRSWGFSSSANKTVYLLSLVSVRPFSAVGLCVL